MSDDDYIKQGWCLFIPEAWGNRGDLFPLIKTVRMYRDDVFKVAEEMYGKPWRSIYRDGGRVLKVSVERLNK